MTAENNTPPSKNGAWSWRRYALSALALSAIIAAAVLIQSLLHPETVQRPVEFLPSSTKAAVVLDVRADSPAVLKMREVWPAQDISHLAGRAAELSQEIINWTGLQLDVKKDVAPWFAGEIAAAAVPVEDDIALNPRSIVVVARTNSLRRARAALDRAVKPMAHDLEWRRFTARRPGGTIIVWRDSARQDHVAYATRNGCVIVSASLEAVERCLVAASDPEQRLVGAKSFEAVFSRLPKDSVAWAYLDAGYASAGARWILPALRHGWTGLLRQFAREAGANGHRPPRRDAGALAIAAAPEKDGLRLQASYASADRVQQTSSPTPTRLARLASLLPRETVAYALIHEPRRFVSLGGERGHRLLPRRGWLSGGPFSMLDPTAFLGTMPSEAMIAALPPRDGEAELLIAAPSEELVGPMRLMVASSVPHGVSAEIGGFLVVASSDTALQQSRQAASDEKQRLSPPRGKDCEFEVWARAGLLSGGDFPLQELLLRGWVAGVGGEGEMVLRARPRRLLGGN